VAVLIYYAAFTYVPGILDGIIPKIAQYMPEEYAYISIILSTLSIATLLWNLSILFVYKSKLPFF
jgi:hypothetical protein